MRKACTFVAIALAICLAVDLSNYAQATDEAIIKCSGADSMLGRMHTIADLFMHGNPNIKVDHLAKGETVDAGIRAVLNKKADVAMASRRMNQAEKEDAGKQGLNLSETLIGYGGIVVLTHSSNPLGALTVDQVQRILKGEYTSWKQLGGPDQPIEVFRSDITHPGTLIFMQEDFLGGAKFTDKATPMATFPEILREVSKKPGAIGYVRIRDAFEGPRSAEEPVKIMAIKKNADAPAVMPSRETIRAQTYAIKRPYYLYWDTKANDAVKKFVDFVVSKGWGPAF
jgi:phosphate transport system substrate-binding protein